MYTVEGNITLEDYQNANRLHRRAKGFRFFLQALVYIYIALMLAFVLFLAVRSPSLGTILPLLILVGLFIFIWAYIPRRIRKVYEQQKELHLPYTMNLDEAGFHMKNEVGESNRPWNMFVKWKEDNNLIMLYHSDVLFSMISKRYLNEEALRFLHEQLRKHQIPEK
jgi:hypothetical protein